MGKSVSEDVAGFLAVLGHGTIGTDMYIDDIPEFKGVPDNLIAVTATAGFPSSTAMGVGENALAFEHPGVQVIVRNNSSRSAQLLIYEIFKDLASGSFVDAGVTHFLQSLQSPFKLRVDENRRSHYVCNFQVTRNPSL